MENNKVDSAIPGSEKEKLENRLKWLDAYQKIGVIKDEKIKFQQESEKRDLEVEYQQLKNRRIREGQEGYNTPIDQLLSIARAYIIDNEKTQLSDPVLRSLWTLDELELIKKKILMKMKLI